MKLPPVEVLLTWPTPNYQDPVTRGPALVIVNVILIALVMLTVAARLYTRLVIKRWFGLDDVFILIALVSVQLIIMNRHLIYIRYLQWA
jgi:hypothetical protein